MNENCGQGTLRSDAAKWLRLIVPGEQRGFYKFKARGQNKISFSISLLRSLVKIAIGIRTAAKFFRETEGKRLRPELLQPDPAKVLPNSWQDC